MVEFDVNGNYVKKILFEENKDRPGKQIDAAYWRELWNTSRHLVNYHSDSLELLFATMKRVSEEDGASQLPTIPLEDGSGTNVAAQLAYLFGYIAQLRGLLEGAKNLINPDFSQQVDESNHELVSVADQLQYLYDGLQVIYDFFPYEHNDLPDRNFDDAHPMSAITGLLAELEDIREGKLELYNHNEIGARDAANSHPIPAITGLQTILDTLTNTLATHAHRADAITVTNLQGNDQDMQSLVNSMYTLLQAATGMAELYHGALLGRTQNNAHPISAITGLQAELDAKTTPAAMAALYQPKIIVGDDEPEPGDYPEGTIYLRIRS